MIRSRRKRNTIAMITAMAVVLCMAAPVSAAYETTFGGFKCRGLDIPAYSGKQIISDRKKREFMITAAAREDKHPCPCYTPAS